MKKEEIERFVRNTIAEFGFEKDGIRRIADAWKEDVDEAYGRGVAEGRDAGWNEAC